MPSANALRMAPIRVTLADLILKSATLVEKLHQQDLHLSKQYPPSSRKRPRGLGCQFRLSTRNGTLSRLRSREAPWDKLCICSPWLWNSPLALRELRRRSAGTSTWPANSSNTPWRSAHSANIHNIWQVFRT